MVHQQRHVFEPVAQRRGFRPGSPRGGSKDPRGKCRPGSLSWSASFVAPTTRTLTGMLLLSPTRRTSRSCNTRSSFVCSEVAIELTSSRKIVPRFASSKSPLLVRHRAGEGALLVTEQLGLEQVLRQRAAVDRDEWLMLPVAVEMQRARDQFLAGAAFALDQNRAVGVGDLVDQIVNLLHLLARADDVLEPVFVLELLPQIRFSRSADWKSSARCTVICSSSILKGLVT